MMQWRKYNLEELTTKIGSGATPRGGKNAYKSEGISLFRSLNVHDGEFRAKNLAFIDDEQAAKLSNVIVQDGDVLLNITGASIARCCVAPCAYLPARVNQHVSILRPRSDLVDSSFLSRLLVAQEYKGLLLEQGDKAGATRQALTKGELQKFTVPLPPLAEQERIVAILDEAFAAIATATANAEKNLAHARELFESELNRIFSQKGEGWVETTLGGEVDFLAGFAFKSNNYTDAPDGIPLLRGDNIVQGKFRWDGVKKWPCKTAGEFSKFALQENDVVLAMDRPWVAAGLKVAVLTQNDIPCLQVQRTARLRTRKSMNWRYLFYLIRSPSFVDYILGGQTGLGVPHISGKQILGFHLLRPSISEQKTIVLKLDALSEETHRLEALYRQKLTALAELKQSILQKAFSGELTHGQSGDWRSREEV